MRALDCWPEAFMISCFAALPLNIATLMLISGFDNPVVKLNRSQFSVFLADLSASLPAQYLLYRVAYR
jgi:hypothetical protein